MNVLGARGCFDTPRYWSFGQKTRTLPSMKPWKEHSVLDQHQIDWFNTRWKALDEMNNSLATTTPKIYSSGSQSKKSCHKLTGQFLHNPSYSIGRSRFLFDRSLRGISNLKKVRGGCSRLISTRVTFSDGFPPIKFKIICFQSTCKTLCELNGRYISLRFFKWVCSRWNWRIYRRERAMSIWTC